MRPSPVLQGADAAASAPPLLMSAPNFRDLGGLPAAGGRRVRHGRVFRSEVLSGLGDDDLGRLQRLGIGAACDLRHGMERQRQRNRWPPGATVREIGEQPKEAFAAAQPEGLRERLLAPDFDPDEARTLLMAGYRRMPLSLAESLRAVLEHLRDEAAAPLLIHCTSGKDRSGFVVALLLAALEVPRASILDDYLLSHHRYPVEPMRQMLARTLGDQAPPGRLEQLLALVNVQPAYLEAAFDEIDLHWGGPVAYLRQAVGVDDAGRRHLQARLLQG